MNESLLNRILKDHKRRTRSLALILCLSMIVSLGTFAGFHKTAIAKVYTREVLDCPYTHEGAEPVAHVHNDDCYEGETLVCTLPEREAHTHDDTCYAESRMLNCGLEENPGHQHSEECFDENGELICQIPEGEGAHVHTDACYTIERALVCNQPELPVHVHGPECFRTEEITVDEPEETAEPEQAVSTVPEMPVSDPNADLETADDWNREFENLELSGNWARDLVLVAATQQGRGESPNNFEAILNDVGDAWVRHGYTRYGAWYGYPYAEWDAMFVSFCLRYAGIPAENVPNNPTAALMAESFQKGELFAGRDYVPAVGDLIFFDTVVDDEITNIDHMGIVYHVDPENGTINTVEGDRTDAVATFGYYLNDEQIVGYGILPQNPNYIPVEGENTDITDEAFDGFIFMTTDEEEEPEETPTAEEAPAPAVPMPAQSWERTAGGIKVSVEAPEGAFPENTKIAVTPVNGSSLKDTVSDAVDGAVLEVQAVDITFFDAEGREIEPAVPIRVVMTPAATQHAEEKTSVVHVDIAQQTAELIEQAEGTETDNSEVVFDAEAFTICAIVYTVDFEYEGNVKLFTSSMPGAEDMPLSEIVKGLGIVGEEELDTFLSKIVSVTSTNEEVAVVTEDRSVRVLKDGDAQIVIAMQDGAAFSISVEAEGVTEISDENEVATVSTVNDLYLPAAGEVKAELLSEEQSGNAIAAVQTTAESSSYQAFSIALENVDVTAYDGFNVAVTLPQDAVVGRDFQLYQIKEDGTATDLTESLTVTGEPNEDGLQNVSGISFTTEDFADFVLSYSIETFYTTAGGDTYKITLNYGPKAGIPEGAELKVKEILPEDESYTNYLNESAAKLGVNSGDVSFARFFDIEIRKDDEKIEPLAPVQVTISYQDALELGEEQKLSVIHFAEEGTELITEVSINDDATEITYEQSGFSVTATLITPEMLDHPSVDGLDGLCATINNYISEGNNWYLCGKAVENSIPAQLVKTNNAAEATQWYFEKVEGGYYIYTIIGGAKKYLNINPTGNGTSANVTVGEQLNVLTVSDSDNSGYEISRKVNDVTYYINRWQGSNQNDNNGFAGYKDRDNYTKLKFGFSLEGKNEQYAVIIKHHLEDENRDIYYMVQNDGSLMEVDYSEEKNEVYLDYPMLWNLSSENVENAGGWYTGPVTNLRIPTEASGFSMNLPSGYYYRYINPNTSDGITEEAKQGEAEAWDTKGKADAAHPGYVWDCRIIYDNANHHIKGHTNYIGIDTEQMKIVGNVEESNAAEVYLAKVTSVPPSNNLNHTVNHIDISIKGGASLSVALAYGEYHYYVDGEKRTLMVSPGNDVTLELKKDSIDITPEDMKTAEITAFSQKNGILDDAFYITGYSQNMRTDETDPATAQVRIEGSFKVADLEPYPADPEKTTEDNDKALTEDQLQRRLNNRIYYTVTAKKEVEFPWEYEYEEGKKAQLYDSEGTLKSSTVMVNLSKSFDYWDEGNECPPIKDLGGLEDWKKGHIVWDTSSGTGSGMDFKLEAHAELAGDVAIEIYKYLRTNEGDVLLPRTDVTNTFVVYQKTPASVSDINSVVNVGLGEENPQVNYSGYTGLHAKSITVGASGEGMVYDYDVDEGMTYVIEDENSIPHTITDINGQKWKFISTRSETEYAWRTAEDYDGKRHVVDGFTSIPDVVGNYGTWVNSAGEEEPLFNRFLEFHFYNIYEKEDEVVTLPVEKTWTDFKDPEYKWTARFQLQYIERKIEGNGEDTSVTKWTNYTPEKILTIHKDAELMETVQATFGDLPKYRVDENGNKYERQYSAEELDFTVWKVVGGQDVMIYHFDGTNYTYGAGADNTAVYKPFYDHDANENWDNNWTLRISNGKAQEIEPRKINLTLKKEWSPNPPENASAEFVLKRYVQNEYVDYTGKQTNPNITVELRDQNNNLLSSVETKSGMSVYIDATFAPNKTGVLTFTKDGTTYSVENTTASNSKVPVRSSAINVTGNEGDKIVVQINERDLSAVQEGSAYNLRITDHLTGTVPLPDSEFSWPIHLPVEGQLGDNAWQITIPDLTVEEGEWNEHGTQANYKIYSYYVEEVSSNPGNYRYSITDSADNVISPVNRVYNGDLITATNTEIGDHIRIEKRWFRLVADEMPPVVIRVTQTENNNTTDVTQDAYDDFGNVVKYVNRQDDNPGYSGYILDKNNGWAINLEGLNPNVNRTYTEVGIIIDGDPANNYEDGHLIPLSQFESDLGYHVAHYYFNPEGVAPPENSRNELISHYIRQSENSKSDVNGTMFVYNVPAEGEYQLAVKKQWFEFSGKGGFSNITRWYGNTPETAAVGFIVQVQQIAFWHGTEHRPENVAHDWTDYRDPLEIRWRAHSQGDFEEIQPDTEWLTVIKQYNFAKNGYAYNEANHQYQAVDYEYRFVEVGVIQGTDGRLWSKSTETTGDPTKPNDDHRFRISNFEVGQIELQKQWKLNTIQQAEEVYFKIYSDWWFKAYGAEKAANGKYDVADIIGRDINNPSLSQEEKTALEKYWLYNPENANNLTVKEIAGLGYVFALKGTGTLWKDSCVRGLPLLQADPSLPGEPQPNGYGEVLYTVSEVGAWYNGGLVKVGDSSWPYVNPLYYRSVRGQGENLVSNGETFQIDNMRGEEPSYFKAVNSDIPSWSFHANKVWDKIPEKGADIVFELQAMRLKREDVAAVFAAYNSSLSENEPQMTLTPEQEADGIHVSNLTPEQIRVLINDNSAWYTAEIPNPSIVLPRSWDYLNMPETTEEERAEKAEATAAAWAMNWSGLPMTWKNESIQNPEEDDLLYRVVETSSPAWTTHTISSLMVGADYNLSQTVTNKSEGTPGDLQITKKWDGSTDAAKWPEGYIVNYKVVQHAYLADVTEVEPEAGSDTTQKILQYLPNKDRPLFDSEDAGFTDYTATYTEDSERKEAVPGVIEKNQNPVTLTLPKGAMWTAPEQLTEKMEVAGIQPGKTYSIAYTYEIVETGVTADQMTLPFTATSGELDISTVSEGTINNDTTQIKVVKEWQNYEPKDGDQIGVKLFVSTTKPGEKIQSTFTVKIGNWLNNTVAPESGSVEVNLAASDGSTQTVTLSAPNWSVPVTVNKYGNDENGPEVIWTIQSIGTPTGIPEGTMQDLGIWQGHNEPTNTETLELQATGAERKNTGSITIQNVDYNGIITIQEPSSNWTQMAIREGESTTLGGLVEGQTYSVKLGGFSRANNKPNPTSAYPDNVVYYDWYDSQGYSITATSGETIITLHAIPFATIKVMPSDNSDASVSNHWGIENDKAPIGSDCTMHVQWQGQASTMNVSAEGATNLSWNIYSNWGASGGQAKITFTPTDTNVTLLVTLSNNNAASVSNRMSSRSLKMASPSAIRAEPLTITPSSITVALSGDAGISGTAVIVGQNELPRGATPVFGDTEVILNSSIDSTTGSSWSHLWDKLPKADKDGNTLYYYVVETSTTVQGTTVHASYGRTEATESEPETIKITNTVERPEYGSFQVTKAVEGVETDRVFTIKLKREKNGTPEWLQYTSDGHSWGEESNASTWTFNDGGTVTFTGLDLGYSYTAVEETGTGKVEVNGYDFSSDSTTTARVEVTEAQQYTGTITNKYTANAFIKIIKVEKDHRDATHKLTGAKFQLIKVDENGHNTSEPDAYDSSELPVNENGELTFTGLRPGRYKLEEKKAPDGYVLTEGPWYFTVNAGTATLEGTYTLASAVEGEGHSNEFWIENTPGTQLPQTGGIGTTLFTALGGLMTATAGAILTIRRKRKPAKG